jgi:hypothetical protein
VLAIASPITNLSKKPDSKRTKIGFSVTGTCYRWERSEEQIKSVQESGLQGIRVEIFIHRTCYKKKFSISKNPSMKYLSPITITSKEPGTWGNRIDFFNQWEF